MSKCKKSAIILGQDYGLNGQKMNKVLVKHVFLIGLLGDYSITEKGQKFVQLKDIHRGTGGYAHFNRYWTQRTFDDSIKIFRSYTRIQRKSA